MDVLFKSRLANALGDVMGQGPGAFVLVDGQYGSTGKGLAAAVVAEAAGYLFDTVTTNAGPNSGHTSYFQGQKIVLQQLPTFGVVSHMMGHHVLVDMNAGAIVDEERLRLELDAWLERRSCFHLNPNAAKVDSLARATEEALVGAVGSTGKGTGAALARKIMRQPDAVVGAGLSAVLGSPEPVDLEHARVFVEVSQGFSLSLNAGGFYPYCTSRDCTVAQAMSDAGLHPSAYQGSMMVVRTFPIRVAGNSGPHYPDQDEISWGELGVEPEMTTVTKKVRRVFTWSDLQFIEALRANRPDMLFFNFMNYLPPRVHQSWLAEKLKIYRSVMGRSPSAVLTGHGPLNTDVEWVDV